MNALKNLLVWQNYVHYLELALGTTIFMHVLGVHIFHTANFLPNLNFLYLTIFFLVLDTLIHIKWALLPEPWKWED